ncbi:MAG TPA: hypothetical protein VIK69_06035 [Methylophilaceae bacterium]
MTDDTIHTCSYSCERPGCIRAQRDELVAKVEALSTDLRAMRAELERAMEARQLISDDLATAEARAERLAEALRHQRWCRTCAEDGWESCEEGRKNDALLRDQEEGSGAFWGPLPKNGGPDWTGYGG